MTSSFLSKLTVYILYFVNNFDFWRCSNRRIGLASSWVVGNVAHSGVDNLDNRQHNIALPLGNNKMLQTLTRFYQCITPCYAYGVYDNSV